MPLNGNLSEFSVEHVLRLIALSRQTGVLRVRTERGRVAIDVSDGAVVGAHGPDGDGELALGAVLDERAGTFSFRPGVVRDRGIRSELDALLERSRASVAELREIRSRIPDDRARFALSARATSGSFTLDADAVRVLLAVDGRRDVAAIASHRGLDRLTALRQLVRLIDSGLVEASAAPAPVAVEASGPAARAVRGRQRRRAELEAPSFEARAAPPADTAPEPIAEEDLVAGLDLRLAALSEVQDPNAIEERPAAQRPEAGDEASLIVVTPSVAKADGEEAVAERTVKFELHYLPATVAPPELEMEKPATPGAARRSPFGFLRLWTKREGGAPPRPLDVPSPPQLAALANELFAEYRRVADAQRELAGVATRDAGRRFEVGLDERLQRIYATNPVGRRLPVRDRGVDVVALRQGDYPPALVLPYLATLVRELRNDAEAAWGADTARAIYRDVAARIFGAEAAVATPTEILQRAAAPVRGRLTIRSGGTGGPFELGPRAYLIGRSSSCDIVLLDSSVSGRHARLAPHLEGFQIVDLGSTNGTKVNGEPLGGERLLRGGEVIRLGDATLLFERLAADAGR